MSTRLPPLFALVVAAALGACAPARTAPPPARAPSAATLDALGDRYADVAWFADSLALATSEAAGDEGVRAAADLLATRLARLDGGLADATGALTVEQLADAGSLWWRIAIGEAAAGILRDDARRLATDPGATPAELHDLAREAAGALELGRVSSRLVALGL